jgi:L,D-peptidoglycan transpeptidase YkuD (ErfK/YbiS/YcfS/YnhG family)
MSHASHGRHSRRRVLAGAASLLGTAALLVAPVAAQAASAAAHAAAAAPRFPVPVRLRNAQQVITVQAHGSYATVTAWQLGRTGWQRVFATTAARIGAHGLADGATRKQDTLTTPTGTYTITQGFGNGAAPRGTRMPYHRVASDDW